MDVSNYDQGAPRGVAWIRHAASELRRMERDHLALFPGSMACPLCAVTQINPGFCPRCREGLMEAYRPPRAD